MEREGPRRPGDQGTEQHPLQLSHLKRREIQAPIAGCLIRGFAEVMGRERALEAATAAVQADAQAAGRAMAARFGGNTIRELARIVREVWAEDDAMVVNVLAETEHALSFDVTRCGYAELYEKAGMSDLGFCLSCSRDEPFARGFNPRMRLVRSETIMEGGTRCDFRFVLDRAPQP